MAYGASERLLVSVLMVKLYAGPTSAAIWISHDGRDHDITKKWLSKNNDGSF